MNIRKIFGVLMMSVLMTSSFAHGADAAEKPQFKIRWLLAHEPARVFERAAKQFKAEVEKNSGGRIAVEVLTPSEFTAKYGVNPKFKHGPLLDDVAMLKAGDIEMTQTYTTSLGRLNPKMWVFDLPFLFRDHAHAKAVIDGEIGQKVMANLVKNDVRGLAFTYSGGYRVISSREKPISTVEDFKSMTIRTSTSPIARATFEKLGAKTVPMSHDEGILKVKEGSLMAAETTIARYDETQQKATPILNDTQHSLFLTSMVVNEKFYAKLPQDLKDVVYKAARVAAETERQDSLKDESELRSAFASNGTKVVAMPKAEVEKMRALTKPVYKQFHSMLGADLIRSIEEAQ